MPEMKDGFTCVCCRKTYPDKSSFTKSNSPLYNKTGHVPICKDCMEELFRYYEDLYKDTRSAIKRVCMACDIYYNDKIYEASISNAKSILGNYLKKLNIRQNANKTFDNTLKEGFKFSGYYVTARALADKRIVVDEGEETVEEIDDADIAKWGYGFHAEDYKLLNQHYEYLKNANPNCDSNQEIFVIDLCYTNMQKMKAMLEGNVDNYNKLAESYRKSFNQAKLKTASEESTVDEDSWSSWTHIVSQYTPEEYYKNKQLYKDIDGIGEYYDRHAIRPLKNLVNSTNERDSEFYVHESEDDDD